jgi:hypothetical protein
MASHHLQVMRTLSKQNTNGFATQTMNHQKLLEQYKQNSSTILHKVKSLKQQVNKQKNRNKINMDKMNWCNEYKRLCDEEEKINRVLECDREIQQQQIQYNMKVISSVKYILLNKKQYTLQELQNVIQQQYTIIENLEQQRQQEYNQQEIHELYKNSKSMNAVQIQYDLEHDHIVAITKELSERIPIDDQYEDTSLRDQSIYALYCYDTEVNNKMNELKQQYITQCIEYYPLLELQLENNDMKYFLGFWEEQDHDHYRKLLIQYKSTSSTPSSTGFIDQCVKEMPHLSKQEIEIHDQWYNTQLFHKQKLSSLRKNYQQVTRPQLVDQLVQAIEYSVELNRIEEERLLEVQQRQVEHEERYAQLNEQRQLKAVELEKELEQKQLELQKELERKQMEEEKKQQYHMEQKQLLIQYKVQEQIQKNEMDQRKIYEEEERNVQYKQQQQYNAQRVAFRKEHVENTTRKKIQTQLDQEEDKLNVQLQLDQLRDQVRKRLQLDQIEPDFDRLTQHTETSMYHIHPAEEEHKTQYQHTGYTMDELVKDKRFKLGMILREVGLFQTSQYARDVVLQQQPFKQPRKDMFTSDQIQHNI